eukprot:TRINITY_DN25369_c0_g1_i1.p1 TRINITY_DN25369_c0_g1~~TRINITY_DN25369_c0_g1_i1.p1  ORF type:complete len:1092 (+),score=161.49 TRINITY_DN25369_c0_g1_i1:135-3410(+)
MSKICESGGKGVIFPLSETEHLWNPYVRAILYAGALMYCFLGLSMASHTLMSSIEAVTSRRTRVRRLNGRFRTGYVWNDVVADLSLVSIGSSAPELFLSIVDLVRRGMHSSDLGPSVIVGSSAFNLLAVLAVCVAAIQDNELRRIRKLSVFYMTTAFLLVAYLWVLFVLHFRTPDVVEVWEAVLTCAFLPLLISLVWRLDVTGWPGLLPCCWLPSSLPFSKGKNDVVGDASSFTQSAPSASAMVGPPGALPSGASHDPVVGEETCQGDQLNEEPVLGQPVSVPLSALHLKAEFSDEQQPRGFTSWQPSVEIFERPARRRISFASHHNTVMGNVWSVGGLDPTEPVKLRGCAQEGALALATIQDPPLRKSVVTPSGCTVQFLVDRQSMSDDHRRKVIKLIRFGDTTWDVNVRFCVEFLTEAIPGDEVRTAFHTDALGEQRSPATHVLGEVSIQAGCEEQAITVHRPSWNMRTPRRTPRGRLAGEEHTVCDDFMVYILEAATTTVAKDNVSTGEIGDDILEGASVELGLLKSTYVEVVPSNPGELGFHAEAETVMGSPEPQELRLLVLRRGGSRSTVSCRLRTEALSAVPGWDYQEVDTSVVFQPGETERMVSINIVGKEPYRSASSFMIVLSDAQGGATFDPNSDGGFSSTILTVTVLPTPGSCSTSWERTVDEYFNINLCRQGLRAWQNKLWHAVFCHGTREEYAKARISDICCHYVATPWKLFFLPVPPPMFFGGWLCFVISLIYIAFVTVMVADLSEIFGCVVGIPDTITAITFVALGTSMPNMFASKVAVTEADGGDTPLINIVGSSAVKVFFGLGLPWLVGSIYWNLQTRSDAWDARYDGVSSTLKGEHAVFVVKRGSLCFAVAALCFVGAIAIFLLGVRRRRFGAELGGPSKQRTSTSLALLLSWDVYVGLVSWHALRWPQALFEERSWVIGICVAVVVVASLLALMSILCSVETLVEEPADICSGSEAEEVAPEEPHVLKPPVSAPCPSDDILDEPGASRPHVSINPTKEARVNLTVNTLDHLTVHQIPVLPMKETAKRRPKSPSVVSSLDLCKVRSPTGSIDPMPEPRGSPRRCRGSRFFEMSV